VLPSFLLPQPRAFAQTPGSVSSSAGLSSPTAGASYPANVQQSPPYGPWTASVNMTSSSDHFIAVYGPTRTDQPVTYRMNLSMYYGPISLVVDFDAGNTYKDGDGTVIDPAAGTPNVFGTVNVNLASGALWKPLAGLNSPHNLPERAWGAFAHAEVSTSFDGTTTKSHSRNTYVNFTVVPRTP